MSWEPFRVRDAKAATRHWVEEVASRQPGFRGAFFHGSINWLADDTPLLNNSDIDVIVIRDGPDLARGPGKFTGAGILLDVSYLTMDDLGSADAILANSHLAGSFRGGSLIADPTGELTQLQAAVSRDHTKRHWVERRVEHAIEKVLRFLDGVDPARPLHEQVTSWLFGTSVTTHVLLVAGLRNPTVRKRYQAARELLADYDRLDFYNDLLGLLGCAEWTRAQTERHLAATTVAFDAAREVIRSPFPFAADISEAGRSVAIDGSQELIESGDHREAVFWIAATYARCQAVLHLDAPTELKDMFTPAYRTLLADLGITLITDLQSRADQVRAFLPRLTEVADQIIVANTAIEREPL